MEVVTVIIAKQGVSHQDVIQFPFPGTLIKNRKLSHHCEICVLQTPSAISRDLSWGSP